MASVKYITSPVGGWDVKTALADMTEDTATLLDNWFPNVGRVDIRPGYSEYATGLGGDVETLAEFINGPLRKLIAGANGNIWDISSSGAASSLYSTSITSNRWQTANMDGKMGLVNGSDAPLEYDGTTVSTMTVSGPTINNLIGINVFSSRSYFWEDDSQDFWYSATNALGGALTIFPLSRVGQFGGKLIAMGTWTKDGGAGMNDLAVFFMSSGEVIVYSGSDPASFSLVGVFRIGAPLSIRGAIKLGGDLVVITRDGYEPLKGVIEKARLGTSGLISDQINPAVTEAAQAYGGNYGWEAFHYPQGNMLIFNIPLATNTTYNQHVFNTNTGKPCRFKNINARCWGLYNDNAYFGGNGSVYKFDDGYDDNGSTIDADCVAAVTYLGSKAQQKLLTGVQVTTSSDGEVSIAVKTEADFKLPTVAYSTEVFTGGSSDWDTADWDTAEWSGGNQITNDWVGMGAFGYNFRTRVRLRAKGQLVKWYSINYLFDPAGLV